ncbi:transmembrane protein, putative [Medicago truncatula]|uniref:Transmembrane protein, putative n=1 Tax=Medicago truncatula TaxID=3880 RepID=G7LEN7_MEDTR|nr:transmembrane protein, putative [Medicago truncatula]
MMNSKEGMGNNSIESEFECIEKPTWFGLVGFGLRSVLFLKVLGSILYRQFRWVTTMMADSYRQSYNHQVETIQDDPNLEVLTTDQTQEQLKKYYLKQWPICPALKYASWKSSVAQVSVHYCHVKRSEGSFETMANLSGTQVRFMEILSCSSFGTLLSC